MSRIRTATKRDAASVAEVISGAYSPDKGAPAEEACRGNPEEWYVLEHEGAVASVCRVFVQALRVGKCAVDKADVGWVGTRPELQGQGLGSELMIGLNELLREAGCHIGRLGGLIRFYERFGWQPFPRRTVEFVLQPAKAGANVTWPDEHLTPPGGFGGAVVPYHSKKHYHARAKLYEEMRARRSGSVVVTWAERAPNDPPDETGLRLACVDGGEVVGYLFAHERPDAGPFDAKVEIGEWAYRRSKPEALAALLVQALREAYARGAETVVARMPFDSEMERAMVRAGVWFRWVELHSAPASNMIRVLNLGETLRAVCPELEDRLAASPVAKWAGEIALCLPGGECVVLEVGGGKVAAWDWAPGKIRVDLDQATMVSLLFGIKGLGECATVQAEDDSIEARAVCGALFPRCPTDSGAWG